MFGKTSQLEVSRRVATYYLMFGLAAIACLVAEILVVSRAVVETRTESHWLARLDQAANATRSSFSRSAEEDLQGLVHNFRSNWGLKYAAVVSNEGRYLAHTTAGQIGKRQTIPKGSEARWGDVQRVQYNAGSSRSIREYQVPIRYRGQVRGTLVIAALDPGIWKTVVAVIQHSPLAFACPILLLVGGAVILRRTVHSLSEIERQLYRTSGAATVSAGNLQKLDSPGPIAAGWNRLVDELANDTSGATGHRGRGLDARLGGALEGYRQKRSEQILNSLSDGIAVTDEDGLVAFANKALLGLLGLGNSDAAINGKTMEDCLDVQSSGGPEAQLLDPALRRRTVVVEMGRNGDMSQGVLRVARSPQTTSKSESPRGHVWSIRDITQQKLADQMRDQFVNAATHELRTPLANIKAYAETLSLTDVMEIEQQKEFCNTINQEVTRLARFVDDLLHLSRMEVGSTSLNEQLTDVERLMKETAKRARPQMDKKKIEFEVDLPERLPEMTIDKDKVVVALVNLLGNAAKYTPDGGRVRLHVEVNEDMLQIDVEDNGIGISVEELPKVLEKFFRSSDPRVHEHVGSGLGLSLTNEIIRLHGGKLTVHSELNKGSKFTATLPLAPEAVTCSSA